MWDNVGLPEDFEDEAMPIELFEPEDDSALDDDTMEDWEPDHSDHQEHNDFAHDDDFMGYEPHDDCPW